MLIRVSCALLVFAISFSAVPANAAVTFDRATSKTFANTRYVLWNHATAGAARLLLVGVSYGSADFGNVKEVRYAGITLTKLASFEQADAITAELFYLASPPVGNNSLSVQFTGLLRTGVVGATSWTGVDLAAPLGPPAIMFGNSTAPSVIVPSGAGQVVHDVLASSGGTATNGAGQTSRWNLKSAAIGGSGSTAPGASPAKQTSWSLSQPSNWVQIGVGIRPDVTPPTVSITAPVSGTTAGGKITVTADARDNSSVAGVLFLVDGQQIAAEDIVAPFSVIWDSESLPDGLHNLTAVARDSSGNTTTSAPVSVVLDNSPPAISNPLPSGYVPPGTTTVTLSVTTNESATCRYSSTPYVPYASKSKGFSTADGILHQAWEPISTSGTYNYYIRCQDAFSNENVVDFVLTFYMKTSFFAAPTGLSTNSGTLSSPWDLQTAFDNPHVKPGDTLYLRGGVYSRPVTFATENYIFRSNLAGTASAPIHVRPYLKERVIIDGKNPNPTAPWSALVIRGSDTRFSGLEVTDTNTVRLYPVAGYPSNVGDGVTVHAPNTKLINMLVYDNTGNGIGLWSDSPGSELYGTLSFNNGIWQNDGGSNPNWFGGWGHGLYSQNRGAQTTVRHSAFFHNFSVGIAPHGSTSAYLDNIKIDGNVAFENGDVSMNPALASDNAGRNFLWTNCCPTINVAQQPIITNNHFYYTDNPENSVRGSLFLVSSTDDAVVTGNYLMRGETLLGGTHNNLNFSGNTIWGLMQTTLPGNTYLTAPPATNAIFLQKNQYDPSRAFIIVYNWQAKSTVSVDISSLGWQAGQTYELRNVQNYFEDIVLGTVSSSPIVIPMSGRFSAAPRNWMAPVSTFPEFGMFVLVRR